MLDWQNLDTLTRVAVGATAAMIFFLIIPPLGLLCGLIGVGTGAAAFTRAKSENRANPTAQWCMMICVVVMILLIAGNILYSRG